MEFKRILHTDPPETRHAEVGSLEHIDKYVVEYYPAAAVCWGEHAWAWGVYFTKSKGVVNKSTKNQQNPANSLNANQFVYNGAQLACTEPRPHEVKVYWGVYHCFNQKQGEHRINANDIR